MSRRVNAAAVGQILESLFLLRSSRLAESAVTGPLSTPHSATEEATSAARGLLRDSLLAAVEIAASDAEGTSLAVTGQAVTLSKAPVPSGTAAWVPRAEVGTVLEGRDLHLIDLSGARLSASFNRSDLTEALFLGTCAAHCTFNSCELRRADLSGAQFHSCTFLSADATGVVARRAHFSHCVFHRADLSDWDASGATFFQCTFTLSDLSRWLVDGQTTVVKPTGWGRCRRLEWRMKPGSAVRECRVVGDAGAAGALSLAPAARSACRPMRMD